MNIALELAVQRLEKKLRSKGWKRLEKKLYKRTLRRSLPPLLRLLTKAVFDTYTSKAIAAI